MSAAASLTNGRKSDPFEALNEETENGVNDVANIRKHGCTGRIPLEFFEE